MSIIPALLPEAHIKVYCSSPNPLPIEGVTVIALQVPEVENSLGLFRRLIGEMRMGYVAARQMYFSSDRPDLAIISSPGYISALVQTFFAQMRGIPYVLEMRDIYPQVYAEASLLRRDSVLYGLFLRLSQRMYRGAAMVLCATQGLSREVLSEESAAKVKYVYNGFPAQLAYRRAEKHKRFSVCFHGVLGFFQDVETLLQVAEQLVPFDVDVFVIGYGRKEGPLQRCGLPNLRFLGRQSFERTIAEVERCHLGLCLRLNDKISKDAFPVKVWEYLGLGIPSIVTPPSEAGEFLQDHNCGVVFEAGDVGSIVSAILKAKNTPLYLDQLSANCRRLAHSYTREKTGLAAAEAILSVLNPALGDVGTGNSMNGSS
jgi:glycosyltransferase involved in cell wall biosynthesis